jgi:phospholipase/carboxylesterase
MLKRIAARCDSDSHEHAPAHLGIPNLKARMRAHVYHFVSGVDPAEVPLVTLHGSGGNEHELVPVATELSAASPILGIRGTVSIDDGFAFFHRFPDRSIDEVDIMGRIPVLADFIKETMANLGLIQRPIAIGFSNGAIMAAALLLTHPTLLAGAVLFRPLSPFRDNVPVRLDRVPILIVDGEYDHRRSPGDGARLADRFRVAGAMVTHRLLPVGHSIGDADLSIARGWLQTNASTWPNPAEAVWSTH